MSTIFGYIFTVVVVLYLIVAWRIASDKEDKYIPFSKEDIDFYEQALVSNEVQAAIDEKEKI